MADDLIFTQRAADPAQPDVEKIIFRLKNGKLRIVMESEARATTTAFTLLDGEFGQLIEWLVENATSEEGEGEE